MIRTKQVKVLSYEAMGSVEVTFWGGGNGILTMNPYKVSAPTKEEVLKGVNDGEFGVESINSIDQVAVYEVDENGGRERVAFFENIPVPKNTGKRGI